MPHKSKARRTTRERKERQRRAFANYLKDWEQVLKDNPNKLVMLRGIRNYGFDNLPQDFKQEIIRKHS